MLQPRNVIGKKIDDARLEKEEEEKKINSRCREGRLERIDTVAATATVGIPDGPDFCPATNAPVVLLLTHFGLVCGVGLISDRLLHPRASVRCCCHRLRSFRIMVTPCYCGGDGLSTTLALSG